MVVFKLPVEILEGIFLANDDVFHLKVWSAVYLAVPELFDQQLVIPDIGCVDDEEIRNGGMKLFAVVKFGLRAPADLPEDRNDLLFEEIAARLSCEAQPLRRGIEQEKDGVRLVCFHGFCGFLGMAG